MMRDGIDPALEDDASERRPVAADAAGSRQLVAGVLTLLAANALSASRDFYGRELGLEAVADEPELLQFRAGSTLIAFRPAEEPVQVPPGLLLRLYTNDVQGMYKRLRRLGVLIDRGSRRPGDYELESFTVRDPDGYPLEVCRAGEATGAVSGARELEE